MTRVAVVYHSQSGCTHALADALGEGVRAVTGCRLFGHRITDDQLIAGRLQAPGLFEQLADCAAIVFGSPTWMGGVSAPFKAFMDASSELWLDQGWADKLAAGFTVGSGLNGDQAATLHMMSVLASQQGMLWVGLDVPHGQHPAGVNRLGQQLGLAACPSDGVLPPADLEGARYLGRRVAAFARRLDPAYAHGPEIT